MLAVVLRAVSKEAVSVPLTEPLPGVGGGTVRPPVDSIHIANRDKVCEDSKKPFTRLSIHTYTSLVLFLPS